MGERERITRVITTCFLINGRVLYTLSYQETLLMRSGSLAVLTVFADGLESQYFGDIRFKTFALGCLDETAIEKWYKFKSH